MIEGQNELDVVELGEVYFIPGECLFINLVKIVTQDT